MGAVFTAAVLLTMTACSGEFVETKSETDTTALVQQHAEAIATLVGMPLYNPSTGPLPCTGRAGESDRRVYSIQGAYNLDTRAGETPVAAIARVRTDWTAKGYTITDDRELQSDRGVLAAKTPDGFSLDLESPDRRGFAVIVHSPCFTRP